MASSLPTSWDMESLTSGGNSTWDQVQITPYGAADPYTFYCRFPTGGHDTKIDQWHALDRGGGPKATRGRKPSEIAIELFLISQDDLGNYQSMMVELSATKGVLRRTHIEYPTLDMLGCKKDLYYKRGHLPHRSSPREPLVAKLEFLEDLPPQNGPTDDQSAKQKVAYDGATQQDDGTYQIIQSPDATGADSTDTGQNFSPAPTLSPGFTSLPPDPSTDLSSEGSGPD